MKPKRQSDIYELNEFFWKIFGIWPGKQPIRYYKFFSVFVTLFFTIIYDFLLTVNLVYAPLILETLVEEVIFFFTEVTVLAKIAMILLMRDKVIALLNLMDCEEFQGSDAFGKEIINKSNAIYKIGWKIYAIVSNFAYFCIVVFPLILNLVLKNDMEFTIAKYFFLSEEIKRDYFAYWSAYQNIGMFAHMVYNVNVDSFIYGLIMIGITQLKVLNHNFSQLKFDPNKTNHNDIEQLIKQLKYYDTIVKYCNSIQEIISFVIFVQFCMASAIICVSMTAIFTVSSASVLYGMVSYVCAMTSQIFVPGWLGTQLAYESQELVNAAYSSEWISQSESYKRCIRMFIARANTPIVITGLKIFPLSLGTFLSIMKMAYSLFTLIRKMQDR